MGGVNRVILVGRVDNDPELIRTRSDRLRCTFSVVTPWRRHRPRSGDVVRVDVVRGVERHRVVAWGKLGELCAEQLFKGRLVYVEGRLRSYRFVDRRGAHRAAVDVVARAVLFLDRRRRRSAGAAVVTPPAPPPHERARDGTYYAVPDFGPIVDEILGSTGSATRESVGVPRGAPDDSDDAS